MLSSRISNYFKVVDAVEERAIRGDGPEVIIGLVEEGVPEVTAKRDVLGGALRVPKELGALFIIEQAELVLIHKLFLLAMTHFVEGIVVVSIVMIQRNRLLFHEVTSIIPYSLVFLSVLRNLSIGIHYLERLSEHLRIDVATVSIESPH